MAKKTKLTEQDRLERQLAILHEVGKTLTSSLTIKEVLERIFFKVAEVFNPDNWSLLLVDETRNDLYFQIAVGEAAESIKDVRLQIGEGIAGWVAQTGTPLIVPDVRKDPHFTKKVDKISAFDTQSIICLPLKIRDKVVGVIELVNREEAATPDQYELDALFTIADYAAIALENARQFEKIRHLTITDDLSDLYNSRYLHTILQNQENIYKTFKKKFSIIFFDLDSFKKVNDVFGHLMGSQLLSAVGKMVKAYLNETQYGARYGGDEFVIILPDTDKTQATDFCKKLRTKLNKKKFFEKEGVNISLTASFGIATYPDDADTKDKILHIADKRMYTVKGKNKDDIAFE